MQLAERPLQEQCPSPITPEHPGLEKVTHFDVQLKQIKRSAL